MARKIPVTKKNLQQNKLIYNQYEYALDQPYIWYRPGDNGRGGHSSSWNIHLKNHRFPGPWYDHGDISFTVFGRKDKEYELKRAMERFVANFGPTDFAKTPFGAYMKKDFVEQRNAELSELLNQEKEDVIEK